MRKQMVMAIITCLLSFYIIGCGQDDIDTEVSNNLPIVDSFIVPEEFNSGDVLEFKVIAYDEDGDTLSYTWEVDGVILSDAVGTSITWTAPAEVASVKVTVYVTDGRGKSVKRVKTITHIDYTPPDLPIIDENDPEFPLTLITPGKGAFGIQLGDPFKQVKEIHGDQDNPIGVDGHFSYWNDPDLGLSGYVDGVGLVRSIFLRRPNKAKSAGGNGLGSSLKNVIKEFGNAEEIKDENSYWYWKRGINFLIDEDERVERIYVFIPHR